MQKVRQRDNYVDIAKGLAMIAVIRIHTECMGYMHIPYPIIAVPLFFFLSGFYDKSERSIKEWGANTFRTLIITAAIWSLITWLFLSLANSLKNHYWTFIEVPFSVWNPFVGNGATWFLVALFNAKILLWIVSNVTRHIKDKSWHNLISAFIILCLGTCSSLHDLPFLLDEGMAALPFYFAGKIFYPHIKHIIYNKVLLFSGIISLCLMPCSWFPYVLITLQEEHFLLYPIFYLAVLISFAPILGLSQCLDKCNKLAKYGQETLGVLVIHPILLHTSAVVLNRIYEKGSLVWCSCFLIDFIIVCILSYLLTICIKRYCPLLFGQFKK